MVWRRRTHLSGLVIPNSPTKQIHIPRTSWRWGCACIPNRFACTRSHNTYICISAHGWPHRTTQKTALADTSSTMASFGSHFYPIRITPLSWKIYTLVCTPYGSLHSLTPDTFSTPQLAMEFSSLHLRLDPKNTVLQWFWSWGRPLVSLSVQTGLCCVLDHFLGLPFNPWPFPIDYFQSPCWTHGWYFTSRLLHIAYHSRI